jgi:UrcA family protein
MFRTILASLLLLASASAVHAQTEDSAPTVLVNYADLNINTPAGAAALVSRLDHATRVACDEADLNWRDLGSVQAFGACRRAAMSGAVAKIDRPLVYAASHVLQEGQPAQG